MEKNNTFTQELDKFDPTTEALCSAARSANAITVTDVADKAQIAIVSNKRKELKKMRVDITKTGKLMREDAKAFQDAVIAKERELVAIIEPEEKRLADLEDQHKTFLLMEERRAAMPERLAKLAEIDADFAPEEDRILLMDQITFNEYCSEVGLKKNERDRVAMEAERAKVEAQAAAVEAEKQRLAHEAEVKAAEEKAAAEAKVKAEQEAEEKAQREKEAAEQAEKDRIAAEEEARKKAEADARFQEWKNAAGFDDTTDTIEKDGETYIIWRKVSVFNTVFNTSSHDDAPVDNPA